MDILAKLAVFFGYAAIITASITFIVGLLIVYAIFKRSTK